MSTRFSWFTQRLTDDLEGMPARDKRCSFIKWFKEKEYENFSEGSVQFFYRGSTEQSVTAELLWKWLTYEELVWWIEWRRSALVASRRPLFSTDKELFKFSRMQGQTDNSSEVAPFLEEALDAEDLDIHNFPVFLFDITSDEETDGELLRRTGVPYLYNVNVQHRSNGWLYHYRHFQQTSWERVMLLGGYDWVFLSHLLTMRFWSRNLLQDFCQFYR